MRKTNPIASIIKRGIRRVRQKSEGKLKIISSKLFTFDANNVLPIHQVIAAKNNLTTVGEIPKGKFTLTTDIANVNPTLYYFIVYNLQSGEIQGTIERSACSEEFPILIGSDTTTLMFNSPYLSSYIYMRRWDSTYETYNTSFKNVFGKGSIPVIANMGEEINIYPYITTISVTPTNVEEQYEVFRINLLEGVTFSFIEGNNDNELFYMDSDTGEITIAAAPIELDTDTNGIYNINVLATLQEETAIAIQKGKVNLSKLYVLPYGSDVTGNGTMDLPFATLNHALTVLDTNVHSGIDLGEGMDYIDFPNNTWHEIRLNNIHGTAENPVKIGGKNINFQFDGYDFGTATHFLFQINNCSYIDIEGINLMSAAQPGESPIIGWNIINSHHINYINCHAQELGGQGFKIADEGWGTGDLNTTVTHDITYLNCDAYDCDDITSPTPHDGADGFGINHNTDSATPINTWAKDILYKNCRAFNNADDGWDFFRHENIGIVLDNCWSFQNGYDSSGALLGNGIGFKLGPNGTDKHLDHQITAHNCIAAGNRGHGFDQNTTLYTSIHKLWNNIAYGNGGTGFQFGYKTYFPNVISSANELRNNISLANGAEQYEVDPGTVHDHNSWNGFTISESDFVSLLLPQLKASRKADGSLPDIDFSLLFSDSSLVRAGVDVGLPFTLPAPNIGIWDNVDPGTMQPLNLLQNGDFSSPVGWSTHSSWVIADGVLTGTNISYNWCNQANKVEAGKLYRVTFTVVSITSGWVRSSFGGTNPGTGRSASGTYTEVVACTNTGSFDFEADNFNGVIDNVILTEETVTD